MPDAIAGLLTGGTTGAGYGAQYEAAGDASDAQARAAQYGIDEQRRQFDALQALLRPYVQAGTPALQGQQNLIGLGGAGAQQQAIAGIQNSPMFAAMARQGEQGMLQNASATGGLRGGNLQGALGQFRPQLLNQLIEQQYSRLGGLTSLGQNSAAGVGNAGMQTGQNIANLYGQQGAAQAGGIMGKASVIGNLANLPMQFMGARMGGGF